MTRCAFAATAAALLLACMASVPTAQAQPAMADLRKRLAAAQPVDVLVVLDDRESEASMDQLMGPHRPGERDALRRDIRERLKSRSLARLSSSSTELRRAYPNLPMMMLRLRSRAALEALLSDPSIVEVLEDEVMFTHDTSALALVAQPAAAAATQVGAGRTVVVIDSGLDYTRPEFGGCVSPGVPASCRVLAAFDTAVDDGLRDDATNHGSRVGAAVLAIAPQARIVAIDAVTGSQGFSSVIIEGIDWAIANRDAFNIVSINLSLGGAGRFTVACGSGNPFRQPIEEAWQAGIVTVASSGNSAWFDADGNASTAPVFQQGISSPACVPLAISVGAVYDSAIGGIGFSNCSDAATAADRPTCFSQVAPILTLLAPGAAVDLLGTSSYGTSFAAPFVSGAIALLRAARPAEGVAGALSRLVQQGVPVLDTRVGQTFPRLQVAAALDLQANDRFAQAALLTGSSGSVSGSTELATSESGEPAHAGAAASASLWWRWTAPATGTVSFSTAGSSFDTVLAVYTGSAIASLATVAANDDGGGSGSSALSFTAVAGTTYMLAVDGKAGARGTASLSWQLSAWPIADLRVVATPDPFAATAGANVALIVTVSNAGPDASLPALLSITGTGTATLATIAPGCTASTGLVQCQVPGLPAAGSTQFMFTSGSPGAATYALAATVSAAIADPLPSNNSATLSLVFSPPAPDGAVPLPGWALLLAGAGMLGAGVAAQRRQARRAEPARGRPD